MTASPARRYLEEQREAGVLPGARYRIARGAEILEDGWLGASVVEPERLPVAEDTLYDLASLTKPLVTGALAARMARRNQLDLDSRLDEHLPETSEKWVGASTLLDLLSHRSGLPAWLPIYLTASEREGYLREISHLPAQYAPRTRVVYSCLGYILLTLVLERRGGAPLDELARRELFAPLNLQDTVFRPPASLRRRIAATETGNRREREIAGDTAGSFRGWRERVIWGECHDLNAWTLGGVSGNAGLFSTVGDLHLYAQEFLGTGRGFFDKECLSWFRNDVTAGLHEDRSVGWQLARSPNCSAGPLLSPDAMGHTGFTGTSIWIDPAEGWILILLTNRVHPVYRPDDMNAVRRQFHKLAITREA
ncbi:MAG TPA: serine hydrolase domain-containing protein [Candidatus Polarisedimenticolia bacterium]|nr:serine hydrolase domain-containing protein [Candidatus Polarisedimenticolia bacterium]